jgi:hypothetical protein
VRLNLGEAEKQAINNELARLREIQTRIEGYQQKISLFQLMIGDHISLADRDHIVDRSVEFFDALTGGNFDAPVRRSNIGHARLVHKTAADFVAQLRRTKPTPSMLLILFWVMAVAAVAVIGWRFVRS